MKNTIKIIGLLYMILLLSACGNNLKKETDFQEIPFEEGSNAVLPHLTSYAGQLYLSWVDTVSNSNPSLRYSKLQNRKWQPQVLLASGKNWFVNWADYPMIAMHKGKILSHYLQLSTTGKMAYDIKFNVSDHQGSTHYKLLHSDHTATEHGFVSMIPYRDSSFLVTWLDGRNMVTDAHAHGHHSGTMSVRVAEVTAQGGIKDETIVDDSACTCCQTTTSLTANGPVVLYRDCTSDNIRDIVIVRKVGNGWTKPVPIHADNWFIQGCPVNGPKSAAIGNTLAVAWFTASDETPRVQLVFSGNGGEQFMDPILISNKGVLGRVDVALVDTDQAIVSWMQTEGDLTYLYAMLVNKDGTTGPLRKITQLSSSRKSGFPQMELVGDQVYFAWVELQNNNTKLRTVSKPINQFK
ncbi:hypothetical protein [Sphingobacterium anhuiense]|uniref:BNR repeat-containing family member n=1 Tax=Sphingobacterium anhuiense TaxID=493780 RepID=A0ABW5YV32_9SPHI